MCILNALFFWSWTEIWSVNRPICVWIQIACIWCRSRSDIIELVRNHSGFFSINVIMVVPIIAHVMTLFFQLWNACGNKACTMMSLAMCTHTNCAFEVKLTNWLICQIFTSACLIPGALILFSPCKEISVSMPWKQHSHLRAGESTCVILPSRPHPSSWRATLSTWEETTGKRWSC